MSAALPPHPHGGIFRYDGQTHAFFRFAGSYTPLIFMRGSAILRFAKLTEGQTDQTTR